MYGVVAGGRSAIRPTSPSAGGGALVGSSGSPAGLSTSTVVPHSVSGETHPLRSRQSPSFMTALRLLGILQQTSSHSWAATICDSFLGQPARGVHLVPPELAWQQTWAQWSGATSR